MCERPSKQASRQIINSSKARWQKAANVSQSMVLTFGKDSDVKDTLTKRNVEGEGWGGGGSKKRKEKKRIITF